MAVHQGWPPPCPTAGSAPGPGQPAGPPGGYYLYRGMMAETQVGFFLNYPLSHQFTCVGTNWSSPLAEKQAWAKRYHEGGDFHPKVKRGKLVPRLLFGGWCSNRRRRRRRPPPFSKGVMAQPGWHRVPSNPHPDPLGKSERALGKDGEDADISYAVPLTYPSIQKSRFIENKYFLTRHVSNSVGFFFSF